MGISQAGTKSKHDGLGMQVGVGDASGGIVGEGIVQAFVKPVIEPPIPLYVLLFESVATHFVTTV
jgi:hypothetical protein